MTGRQSSAALMLLATIMISIVGSNNQAIFANAASSNDGGGGGISATGQCDLPHQQQQQQSSSAEANPGASLTNQSNSLVLKDRIWISVRQIDFNSASWWVAHNSNNGNNPNTIPQQQPVLSCTLLAKDNLAKIPKILEAIRGADNCKQGAEVCELPTGSSEGGNLEYKQSITDKQAEQMANEITLVANKAILQDQESGKYYLLQLFTTTTTNDVQPPQVRLEFPDDPHFIKGDLIHLEKGQSITIPFVVRTFATFGKPANITLVTGAHARDSGLIFKIEPSSKFIIPERSMANASLNITAGPNSLAGVYRFFIAGKDGWIHTCGEYTDYVCPGIQVGNSKWEIFTTNGSIIMGGKAPPGWLKITTETDKDTYRKGETITIKSYIENDGSDPVRLEDNIRFIVDIGNATILPDPGSTTTSLHVLYTFDVSYSLSNNKRVNDTAANEIVIQPHSKLLLARPFYWNQELAGSISSEGPVRLTYKPVIATTTRSVETGNYTIHTSFSGYDGSVIYDEKNIRIIADAPDRRNAADAISMPSKPEVLLNYSQQQFPLVIGVGAAIAGIVAFLTLRKRQR